MIFFNFFFSSLFFTQPTPPDSLSFSRRERHPLAVSFSVTSDHSSTTRFKSATSSVHAQQPRVDGASSSTPQHPLCSVFSTSSTTDGCMFQLLSRREPSSGKLVASVQRRVRQKRLEAPSRRKLAGDSSRRHPTSRDFGSHVIPNPTIRLLVSGDSIFSSHGLSTTRFRSGDRTSPFIYQQRLLTFGKI